MIQFLFNENQFSFFVADHLLVGQLCTNPKRDRSLLLCLKVTQCSMSEIRDVPLNNSCSLLIQVLYTHNTTIGRNIIKHNDDLQWMNKHLFYKNIISHSLFYKGLMLVVCERWVGDGDRLLHIDPKFFWPYQHFFCILAGLFNRVSLRTQALCLELVLTLLASYLQLELELPQAVCGTGLYNCLTPTCFRFTLVHLLIDGSVEGQYVTQVMTARTIAG